MAMNNPIIWLLPILIGAHYQREASAWSCPNPLQREWYSFGLYLHSMDQSALGTWVSQPYFFIYNKGKNIGIPSYHYFIKLNQYSYKLHTCTDRQNRYNKMGRDRNIHVSNRQNNTKEVRSHLSLKVTVVWARVCTYQPTLPVFLRIPPMIEFC